MCFMLGSDATLQIHFIDIVAIAAVESGAHAVWHASRQTEP
jgi:hypothetical protein